MPDTIRTYDLQLRRLALYPAELRARGWQHILDRKTDQMPEVYTLQIP